MNIKSYTDISQSRKLAKILPTESADMYRVFENNAETRVYYGKTPTTHFVCESCWSLAALLGVLQDKIILSADKLQRWYCECWDSDGNYISYTKATNPVDDCVDMIEKLHEQNLL